MDGVLTFLTGQRGYLGSALIETARSGTLGAVRVFEGDLRDPAAVRSLFERLPVCELRIVHLATINRSKCLTRGAHDDNIRMLENLLLASRRFTKRSVLLASTIDVYGAGPQLPIQETTNTNPLDWYSRSKLACEALLAGEHCSCGVMRLPGVFGPRENERSLIRNLLLKALEDRTLTLSSQGKTLRDFVFLDDVLSLVQDWVQAPRTGLWNVVSGTSFSLLSIFESLRSLSGEKFSLRLGAEISERDYDLCFNAARVRRDFPRTCLRPAIGMLAEYMRRFSLLEPELPAGAARSTEPLIS